ncbi:hypothetical protein SISSUDRAFT_960925, partial [Sistotremastrum suecicum HHB10207 ss-3]
GAFKSCHPCIFRITHAAVEPVGGLYPLVSTFAQLVAKRFIYHSELEEVPSNEGNVTAGAAGGSAQPRQHARYDTATELVHCYTEIKTLYYTSALHEQVYVLMHEALSRAEVQCPFEIPVMQFAAVGVAMSLGGGGKEGVWILERAIPGKFHKYINNNSLAPNPRLTAPYLHIAIFLTFCQHMQYMFTDKRCLITDYQGSQTILTDAQISTRREDSEYFSSGNITNLLDDFDSVHVCNEWCDYFGI